MSPTDAEDVSLTTLDYYRDNAADFGLSTSNLDMSDLQDRFLAELKPGASILDFGCGSGRDSLYFLNRGFDVEAADGCPELCRLASAATGLAVRQMLFSQLDAVERYDGIWACASILHAPKNELPDIFLKMRRALKAGGVIYASFKYGESEGLRHGRYFSDFTEKSFAEFLRSDSGLEIRAWWVTGDVRSGREGEKWLNLLLGRAS
ncbi:MAG: methyltransferase domain-containing protein [Succinivibrionaceae bacterium]|nr:methyltransferase domain-containing protein [Succinivibrionaceae bacterium]